MPLDSPKYSFQNIIPQNFSLPKTVLTYCFQRKCKSFLEKSPEFIYKIYSICKYFFAKIRLIPCIYLKAESDCFLLHHRYLEEGDELEEVKISYQKCDEMDIHFYPDYLSTVLPSLSDDKPEKDLISKIIPRIYNLQLSMLNLQNQELTLKEYLFLTFKEKCNVFLHDCIIIYGNGTSEIVPVEELLKISPKVEQFSLSCSKTSPLNYCTSETAQKLAALQNLQYLNDFSLYNVSETFDALSFIKFIKNVYKPKIKDAEVQFYRFILEFKSGVDASLISNFKQIIQSAVSRTKSKENNLLCIIYP